MSTAQQLVELPQCAFLKLLKLRNAIFNTSNEVPTTSYLKVDKTYFCPLQIDLCKWAFFDFQFS